MNSQTRRQFLKSAAAAGIMLSGPASGAGAPSAGSYKPMSLGLIVYVEHDPAPVIQRIHHLGLPTAQVSLTDFSDAMRDRLRAALDRYHVIATAINTSGPGADVYDFYHGPETCGLVPRTYRRQRIARLKQASDFAKKLGVPAIHTHAGFIPENPNNPVYKDAIPAIREVIAHCRSNGQTFLYEAGQETPVTLLRAIEDVGLDNQAVNLDTANLILYGKGNPVDALDVIGKYVKGIHAKDGLFPTNPRDLGQEVLIGQGKANLPEVIRRLKQLHYAGPITIEREISGPKQMADIKKEIVYLQRLIG